ncbi:winged helix-turn-helix domain-containing protein [Puia dinghuensis]|uniref:Molybdenum transporter n=1 Tax=Puia dinghuensis TaxID=1792502 RepID=A0A8J2UCX9_9BACT|nr:LysR family transcriptional regulator [Puia dinghuensis]GGA98633.1 molybdenum transporter [Puia dinghuensis]
MAKPQNKILPAEGIQLNGRLWLEYEGHRFFGPGPVQLLELIEETGSISAAAKKMQMSYKKAWDIVNNLNTTTITPLVITATGGEKGGGSTISPEARELIDWYKQLRQRFTLFLEAETQHINKH